MSTESVLAGIAAALEDWEDGEDAATWHADGHGPDDLAEHDREGMQGFHATLFIMDEVAPAARERKPVLVVAGTQQEFLHWCCEHGMRGRRDAIFVSSPRAIRGRSRNPYVITGSAHERRDFAEIMAYLRIAGAHLLTSLPVFSCPRCGAASPNPNDIRATMTAGALCACTAPQRR